MTTTAATTAHCTRCGRLLTDPTSVARKLGPTCARRIATAAQACTDAPAQIAKAVELIADGGLVRVAGALYLAVSSDGTTRYEVDAVTGQCACTAGRFGRRCYHVVSAEWLHGTPARPATVRPHVQLAASEDPFACIPNAA